MAMVFCGQRVVRGPDWEYNDDDGGDGCVGTVLSITVAAGFASSDDSVENLANCKNVQNVTVAWDMGHTGDYRTGQDGKYELALLNMSSGLGHIHSLVVCSECQKNPTGYRWFCTVCDDYDLCDECYNDNKHDMDHQFARFASSIGSYVLAPTRESSANVRLEARGLFFGARVSKDGKEGVVVDSPTDRELLVAGAIGVLWDGDDKPTDHTRDDNEQRDIKCIKPARYCYYYKDHLANLGERNFPMVADIASVLMDVDQIKGMQEGHGDWIPQMTDSLRQVGMVVAVTYNGDCKIHYPNSNLEWDFHPDAVTRVEEFGVGDTVRLISDEERVKMIQPGHGEWKNEMSQDLGEEGTVLAVQLSGDVKALINGHPWTLHPACLTLVKTDEERPPTDWEKAQEVVSQKAEQDSLISGHLGESSSTINAQKEEIVRFVKNAHAGNLAAVKQTLEKSPNWVNIQVKAKTALHFACTEGHLEVIKYLVSKKAYLEAEDEKGFHPLHCATFSKKPKVVEYILKQGAYPSVQSNIGLSPLHLACTQRLPDITAMLLNHGCSINMQDSFGDPAIHYAIVGESRECQKLLIESPMINLTLRNNRGYNALLFASLRDSEYAASLILDRMPTLAANKKEDGYTALHVAACANNSSIARILIEKGQCPIDSLSNGNLPPLLLAVCEGATETIEVLVTHGANINLPSDAGQTCMHAIISLLTDPESEFEDSLTLRKIRASMRDIGVSSPGGALACYLVKNGGRLDYADKDGETPMDLVSDPKLKECLEKCLATASPNRSPSPAAAKKEPNAILSRILPFFNKGRGGRRKPPPPRESLEDVNYHVETEAVQVSINPFKVDDTELPTSPFEDFSIDSIPPDHVVTDEDLKKNVEKAAEYACCVCEEQLTQLIGVPCQHVQAWPGEKATAIPSAAAPKEPPKRAISVLRRQNSEFRVALACTVCFQRKKGVVFECGHSTCKECAELLPDCPVCRKPSSKVIPLYL